MTTEEKQLLFKDLCARLPYETWVKYEGKEWLVTGYGHGRVSLLPSVFSSIGGPCPLVEEVRPYLCSMSSMTEEEEEEYELLIDCSDYTYFKTSDKVIDWLLERHFDFRCLIHMGLALEAPEGMYKTT